jgi:hypothetical protein
MALATLFELCMLEQLEALFSLSIIYISMIGAEPEVYAATSRLLRIG